MMIFDYEFNLNDINDNVSYYKDCLLGKARYYLQPYLYNHFSASKITDNIYLSDLASACNLFALKEIGITHVICVVLAIDPIFPMEFEYLNIQARDIAEENLYQYFDECYDFIEDAISKNGKVLIHCAYGKSRSASIVIAYLIKKLGITYDQAYQMVYEQRPIIDPNPGFVEQLVQYYENNCNISKNIQ